MSILYGAMNKFHLSVTDSSGVVLRNNIHMSI